MNLLRANNNYIAQLYINYAFIIECFVAYKFLLLLEFYCILFNKLQLDATAMHCWDIPVLYLINKNRLIYMQ